MNDKEMPRLKIGDLEPKVPIIQGGMGVGISLSGLAAAVANAGGIGVISSAGIGHIEPEIGMTMKEADEVALRKEIKKAKDNTNGVIGVNIMMASSDSDELILNAVDSGADLIFLGAGLPLKLPDKLPKPQTLTTKFVPIVSSARATEIIFRSWAKRYCYVPDAVVVEGPLAGGHLGFRKEQINDPNYALEKILPEVIASIKPYERQFDKNIPVIAAGGIYTGTDIYKMIQLGARGVQMGTRFVTTCECDASIKFKEAYLKCKREDIVIIDSPVGLPGRAIQNDYLERVSQGFKETFRCPWKCLKSCDFKKTPYCIALALTNAKKGNLENGFAFAGANAYRAKRIITVKELISDLKNEYEHANSASCSTTMK